MYIDKDIKFVRFWVGKLIGMPRSPSILVFHLPSVSTTTRIHLRSPDDINHGQLPGHHGEIQPCLVPRKDNAANLSTTPTADPPPRGNRQRRAAPSCCGMKPPPQQQTLASMATTRASIPILGQAFTPPSTTRNHLKIPAPPSTTPLIEENSLEQSPVPIAAGRATKATARSSSDQRHFILFLTY